MIAPSPLQSLTVHCGQRVMTLRLGRLCILLSAREVSSMTVRLPMRNQERFRSSQTLI